MQFSRARYVTLCQQSLVTAAVLAVGVSAAGVKSLEIVPQPVPIAGAREALPGELLGALPAETSVRHRAQPDPAPVDTAPVTPRVREVQVRGVAGIPAASPGTTRRQQLPADEAPAATGTQEDKRPVALSRPQPVTGYATVGVTWKHGTEYADDEIAVEVRTEKAGRWSDWMAAEYHDDHGPGAAESGEAAERPGTDALVIGDVDRVQMRTETADGTTPPDLQLAVIDPGKGTMTTAAPAIDTASLSTGGNPDTQAVTGEGGKSGQISLSAMETTPKPEIYSRAQWGADELMRDQSAPGYGTVKAGFIHHTVNANTYTSAQVPALLRGIYAYHTQSKGWRDIGYNYLVDRFGRIWEGRYGGVTRAVVGAHTSGYNEYSFAMSAIGNLDVVSPPAAVISAYADLFAWKLSLHDIRADAARLYVKNRYLHAINGHRDVGETACPGRYLYSKLSEVRTQAQRLQNAAQSGTVEPTPAPTPEPPPDGFVSPTQKPRPAVQQPAGIDFPRSLNLVGDANPDLVVKSRSGVVQVLPTGGQTGLRAAVSTPGPWARMNKVVAVGDVTGDGRGDVLGRLRDGTARIYRGDGAGHVSLNAIASTTAFSGAVWITGAGDWNRDGHNDVLIRSKDGWLRLVPGIGAGKFGRTKLLSKAWTSLRVMTVASDLTGDGLPDIVGISTNGHVYVVSGQGNRRLSSYSKGQYVGAQYSTILGGGADMTGDGYGDVALRSASTRQVTILPGKPGGFGAALGPFDQAKGLSRLSAAPMAGGPQSDLVGTNSSGTALLVVANNGLVNLLAPVDSGLTVTTATQVLNVGDWNGDGRGDVITRQASGDALVLRPGLGNAKFGPGKVMGHGWQSFVNLTGAGDLTGDRRPDLVGRSRSGTMTIFPGDGASGFKAPVVAPAALSSYNLLGTGVWRSQLLPGSAFVSSDGSFVPFVGSSGGAIRGYDWIIGPGNVDGDRRNDLVVRDTAGTLWLLPGTSTGYGARRLVGTGFSGYSLGG